MSHLNFYKTYTIYYHQFTCNLFKYYAGFFLNDVDGAKNYKVELIEKGFKNAFVIAFLGGERISIEKAIKLAEN